MKKLFSILTIFSLILGSLPLPTLAQSATNSADTTSATSSGDLSVSKTIEITQNNIDSNPFFDAQSGPSQMVTAPGLSLDSSSQTSQLLNNSVLNKTVAVVQRLTKHDYKFGEDVTLVVSNATASDIDVSISDSKGNKTNAFNITKTNNSAFTTVTLSSGVSIKPGKYTVSVTDSLGNITTQDFTWGVLAINTNKSIYAPYETSNMAIAVLDDQGTMVCDASVSLRIQNTALGIDKTLSTDDGSIKVNPQCMSHNFSLIPDYEATYQVGGAGEYSMTLTAITKNGTYSINDGFLVQDNIPFDVERVTATRIYPFYDYPVSFNITANQDFNGTVAEYVPSSFTITPYASSSSTVINYDSTALPNQYSNMFNAFGVTNLSIGMPFTGDFSLTQGFGEKMTDPEEAPYYAEFGLAGHDGLDFKAPVGMPVLSTDDGVVLLEGDGAYGMTIVIQHSWGRSYYGHLSSTLVKEGDRVTKGQEIALSGNSGHTTGAHLHFGIRPNIPTMDNGYYGKVDPSPFLGLMQTNSQVLGASTVDANSTSKIIAWNVNVKKGDKVTIGYNFKTPSQSPELYKIGPLSFFDNNKTLLFQEARTWKLAIDADSTAGPNNCGTGADATGVGTVTWASPNNACTTGLSTATSSTISTTTLSHYLKITNFGFALASNAKIVGIQFSIERWAPGNGPGRGIDNAVRVVKGGTIDTANDHSNGSNWPTSSGSPNTYGTTSDLWGNTWAYSDINASTFGVAISGKGTSSSKPVTGNVGAFVTATITYNTPPNTPTGQSPTNGSTTASTTVDLQMTATDPGSDDVQYVITLYSNSASCTGTPTTYDQGTSQTGWTGSTTTCSVSGDCYASGTQGDLQLSLNALTTYSWTVAARDPLGSNTLGTATSCISFSTPAGGPTLDQLLRHGDWFNASGVRQTFTF